MKTFVITSLITLSASVGLAANSKLTHNDLLILTNSQIEYEVTSREKVDLIFDIVDKGFESQVELGQKFLERIKQNTPTQGGVSGGASSNGDFKDHWLYDQELLDLKVTTDLGRQTSAAAIFGYDDPQWLRAVNLIYSSNSEVSERALARIVQLFKKNESKIDRLSLEFQAARNTTDIVGIYVFGRLIQHLGLDIDQSNPKRSVRAVKALTMLKAKLHSTVFAKRIVWESEMRLDHPWVLEHSADKNYKRALTMMRKPAPLCKAVFSR